MSDEPDPWPVGSTVRVTRPEGPHVRRRGLTGVVTARRHHDAVRRSHPGGVGEVLVPASWYVYVAFSRVPWTDWAAARTATGTADQRRQAGLRAADDWDAFFDRELEPCL